MTKTCPLKTINNNYTEKGELCIKEKCAWWDDFNGACAMAAIATYLRFGFKIRE